MATRSDSQQPPRPVMPPAGAPAQKAPQTAATEHKPLAATPVVDAAVNAALEDALGAASDKTAGDKAKKRRAPAKKAQAVIAATPTPSVSDDERRGMIALSAYLRAERRGFSSDGEAEDWLAAEKEVDALLKGGHTKAQ